MPSSVPIIPWSKTVLLCARNSKDPSVVVQQAALDLFVLGYPSHANKLIDALYEHGHGIQFDFHIGRTTTALYNAWSATDTFPSYIRRPDEDKVFDGHDHQDTWERGLPKEWREKALQGGLSKKDLDIAIQRLNADAEHLKSDKSRTRIRPGEDPSDPDVSMTLGAVVQVASLLDETDVAVELVEKHVPNLYRHVQEQSASSTTLGTDMRQWLDARLGLHHSPRIWKIFQSASIGQVLKIDENALEAFVSKGCAIIKERFTHGPRRPYADLAISELVQLLTVDTPEPVPIPNNSQRFSFIHLPDELSAYLQPPATPTQVAELETQLQGDLTEEAADAMEADEQLPEDYKAFLLASNGFCATGKGDNPDAILYNTEGVACHDIQFLQDYEFELFSNALHSENLPDNIIFREIKGFVIGAGGDEGDIVLFSPSTVKPILEAFEKAYATASDRERRAYERAAVGLYGGIEKLRGIEWLCTMNFHWAGEQEIWGSFRDFLEYLVGYVVNVRWEGVREEKEKKEKEKEKEEKEKEKKDKKMAESEDGKGEKRKRGQDQSGGELRAEKQDVNMTGDEDSSEEVVERDTTGHDREERYNLRDTKSRRTE